ncbi:MAG: glycogen debranching enzyme GlgX, partial [Alphaproteobacteria bacterium]
MTAAPPLGAVPDGRGATTFALFSREAEKVELCLFDESGRREERRHVLTERTGDVWHVDLPGIRPGQLYGYRVYGPHAPEQGLRFNHHKLLIDPHARALKGKLIYHEALLGYRPGDARKDMSFSMLDNAAYVPKCVVMAAAPPPTSARPNIPLAESVIYELHFRGFTRRFPGIPTSIRGTAAALAAPAIRAYFTDLGITAVEVMPVQAFASEWPVAKRGLVNYWGYSPLAFFAPHGEYLAGGRPHVLAVVVEALHDAG